MNIGELFLRLKDYLSKQNEEMPNKVKELQNSGQLEDLATSGAMLYPTGAVETIAPQGANAMRRALALKHEQAITDMMTKNHAIERAKEMAELVKQGLWKQ